jgi:hypothetical protein
MAMYQEEDFDAVEGEEVAEVVELNYEADFSKKT